MSDEPVGKFFDALTGDYTNTIERCFPRYREMLWALLDYLPSGRTFDSVLELGCGTGNLSVLLRDRFPQASLHLVDLSSESLATCRSRVAADGRVTFEQQDFRSLEYDVGAFDLVISSISIHHLEAAEKQALFRRSHGWLTAAGIFSLADQCAGATDDIYARHIDNWQAQSFQAGSTAEEWRMWMQHQAEHDHHDTLVDQIGWLRSAGFSVVDCPWRYLLWSVIQARK